MNQDAIQIKKQKAWRKMEKGQHADAMVVLQKIIKSLPNDAESHYLLGCCQAYRRLWNDAISSFKSSIKLQENVFQSHFSLAGAYIAQSELDAAEASLQQVLKLNPMFSDAYVALGNIQIKRNDFISAREYFEQAIKIDPQTSDAYHGLALLEQEEGQHSKAVYDLEKALKYNPKSVPALCALANSYSNLMRKDEAMVLYRKALKFDQSCFEAQCGIAKLYNYKGEYEKATKLIDPLLKRKILHSSLGLAFADSCKHSGRCEEAILYIDELLNKPGLSRVEIKSLHFAAGKILDRLQRYDEAFYHYKLGNDAVSHLYDSISNTQNVNDIIDVFSSSLFMGMPKANSSSKIPIFIIGMPRSGTSLTEQILAAHTNVCAAGELETLFNIARKTKSENNEEELYPFYVPKLSKDVLDNMSDEYMLDAKRNCNKEEYVTDKMPHNFYLLGLVQLIFPEARVIHCTRDPLDTCLSIYFQDFSEAHTYAKDLYNIGTHYHQYERLMEHWKKVLSIPMLDVGYEDLVDDQEGVTKSILEFCGLEWQDSCLSFHEVERTVNTASYDQVRQPLYKKSVTRWKNYEKYLGELKNGLDREF